MSVFRCFLAFTLCLTFGQTVDESVVVVRVGNGVINGRKELSVDGKRVHVFKGIPFAKPPIGDLRFRRPVPAGEWRQPLDAFEFAPPCYQNGKYNSSLFPNSGFSEDCLYLNVVSPQISDELNPVMVWIHGGALTKGTANVDTFGGKELSAKGVVFVSINYRLNALGFLYSGEESAPGNVGLWDQTLALEWVNDNIRYFGGDEKRITIFGESAGSWSVSLHILSPASRHLFHNAIMNSGAYLYAFNDDRAEDHAKKWLKGAKLIGCEDGENGAKFTEKVMQCLRAAKAEKLVDILEAKELTVGSIKMWNLVVIDGHFLPKRPQEMLSSGDLKRDLNLMVSTTEDEGSFLLAYYYDSEKFSGKTPRNLTFKEAFNELQEISSELSSRTPVDGQEVAKLYFAGLSERNSADLWRQTIGKAVGDYYITCPTLEFAKQVFRRSEFKVKVFQYLFNSKFQDILICGHWMGVCHGNDLFPMFGIPLVFADKFNEREKEISRQMIEILTDFAKKGEPPKQKDSLWPQYYSINDAIIAPYYEFTNELRKDTNFGKDFKSVECEYLWRKYLDIEI